MKVEHLSTSEAHTVDLVAMRRWHWRASMDPNRDHEMRCWHRMQAHWITLRISSVTAGKVTPEAQAVAELLTDDARSQIHMELETVCAGDWKKNCQLAREAILAKLRADPRFSDLT